MELGPLHDFVEYAHTNDDFLACVIEGLSQPQKRLPSKFLQAIAQRSRRR